MTSRNQSLDVLRGVAVLLVIGCHLHYYRLWARGGWCGVDLFFVLSGFLVSGLLFQEYKNTGTIQIRRFILRRGFKIWPAFYVFLLVTGAFLICFAHWFDLKSLLVSAVFLQNYFALPYHPALYHIWSLAVEEHFYLLLPLLILLLLRRGSLRPFDVIPKLFFVIAASCLLFRAMHPVPPSGLVMPMATHLRIDSLFAGVTLGYLFHFRPQYFARLARPRILPLAVLCISPAWIFPLGWRPMESVGITLLYVGFALIVACSMQARSLNPALRPLAFVGRYSYSIYLWQMPIALTLWGGSFLSTWAIVLLCVAVGVAMAKLVEMPMLRVRERVLPAVTRKEERSYAEPECRAMPVSVAGEGTA